MPCSADTTQAYLGQQTANRVDAHLTVEVTPSMALTQPVMTHLISGYKSVNYTNVIEHKRLSNLCAGVSATFEAIHYQS